MFFPVARRGFRVRVPHAPRDAVVAGKSPPRFCKNRQARLLATAQDDDEVAETGLGGGQTNCRLCRTKHLAAGTRGEIELGTIRGVDRKTFLARMKRKLINAEPKSSMSLVIEDRW